VLQPALNTPAQKPPVPVALGPDGLSPAPVARPDQLVGTAPTYGALMASARDRSTTPSRSPAVAHPAQRLPSKSCSATNGFCSTPATTCAS
jgi:hypothetical protein